MNHYFLVSLYAGLSLVPQWFQATSPATQAADQPAAIELVGGEDIAQVQVAPAKLPEVEYSPVQRRINATLFSYSSTVGQTDASPFTTASGQTVRDGIVANNCLPFGTVIKIPSLFGDKAFVVADRMAPRYGCNSFDIWQSTTSAAKQFGKRVAVVEVY